MSALEAGLTTSVRVFSNWEVLGDFVALARAALATGAPESEPVAAVLTLKRLGELNGVDVYNRDYRGVVYKVQEAGAKRDSASSGQWVLYVSRQCLARTP